MHFYRVREAYARRGIPEKHVEDGPQPIREKGSRILLNSRNMSSNSDVARGVVDFRIRTN